MPSQIHVTHFRQHEICETEIEDGTAYQHDPKLVANILKCNRCRSEQYSRNDELARNAEAHAKASDYHREDLTGYQVHCCVQT